MAAAELDADQQDKETPGSDALLDALLDLPLMDDMFLAMQARNVALVSDYIEDLEKDLLREYLETEKTPLETALFVSAITQMWIFALYELLRTWRQRARLVIRAEGRSYSGSNSTLATIAKRSNDPEFVKRVVSSVEDLEDVFRELEGIRVTLAKHEVPKSNLHADAAGYARIDSSSGTLLYTFDDKDGFMHMVSRETLVSMLVKAVAPELI